MECAQHSIFKGSKISAVSAPYCRDAGWWKGSDYKQKERVFPSPCIQQNRHYRVRRMWKQWSIMVLSPSGAGVKSRSEGLKQEFQRLVKEWEAETSFHSSLGEIFTNEAYQRIMAMGREALPWIFGELQRRPGHWFYALAKIVGRDVAKDATSFAEARSVWLEWGRKNHYI